MLVVVSLSIGGIFTVCWKFTCLLVEVSPSVGLIFTVCWWKFHCLLVESSLPAGRSFNAREWKFHGLLVEVFGSLSHLLASCKPGSGSALLFRCCCLQATFVQRNWNEAESGPFKDLIFHQTAQRRAHTKRNVGKGRADWGGRRGREGNVCRGAMFSALQAA